MSWLDLNKDPGEGNLNLRALAASILGPFRTAHGKIQVRQVPLTGAVELASNKVVGSQMQAAYVEVWLPAGALGTGLRLRFGYSESLGESSVLVTLVTTPGLPSGQVNDRFRAVLLPNDALYAQVISDATGAALAGARPVVVSKVTF